MENLPIGIQSFKEIRTHAYMYVDKTRYIHRLATQGKYYFLARPRRFGKSLLLNTLAELFRGEQQLFEGLWIADKWDWKQKFPVIQIGFSSTGYKSLGLEAAITKRLQEQAVVYSITLNETTGIEVQFRELIHKLHAAYGSVVILIDEYDKPIIDYLDDVTQAHVHRDLLKTFYSVLKDSDDYLKMVFITGVSKFSRMSIFSELNNLLDLTMHPSYAQMLGYTQEELEVCFAERIEQLVPSFGGKTTLLAQMKEWYNGYCWDLEQGRVYNPFSVLSFFETKRFANFWFSTGTPTFLVKLLKKHQRFQLENMQVTNAAFDSFALDNISPETLLFQTGYVTLLEGPKFGLYRIGYPNREVRESMIQYLMAGLSTEPLSTASSPILLMTNALAEANLEQLITHLNALLGSIPYDWHQSNEAYYHTVMHLAFSLIGVHIQSEIHTAKRRLDSVIHTDHTIYIFELKVDKSAEQALIQIEEKGYAQPYIGKGKPIVAIGINFSSELKAVKEWETKEL